MSDFGGRGQSELYRKDDLISVARYRQFVVRALPKPEPMEIDTAEAQGLVLTEPVTAPEPLPAFANSAMDGYAVRSADVASVSQGTPVYLDVIGEVVAGQAPDRTVGNFQAMRIMTGAPLPPGADAVVPMEVTRAHDDEVTIFRRSREGEYVRPVGQDVTPGDVLLAPGRRVGPSDMGLLLASGVTRVACMPAPRVTIISTGDELVPAGESLQPGQIRDSNGPMMAAMVRQVGGVPHLPGPAPDDEEALAEAIQSNLGNTDMMLLTGGVSVGVRDLVAGVLEDLGEAARFKVAMQPGMPQVIGKVDDVPVFGLPGNPVSCFVSFEVFIRPALRLLQGRRDLMRPAVTAMLGEDVTSPPHKRSFLRVRMRQEAGTWVATPTGHQGSHMLTSLAAADGLAEISEDATSVKEGLPVAVNLLVDQ